MEKRVEIPKWISIVLMALCVVSAIVFIVFMDLSNIWSVLGDFSYLVATVSAMFYCLLEFKKSAKSFYFETLSLYLLTEFVAVLIAGGAFADKFMIACCTIIFGELCVLRFVKDLGKKKSLILIGSIIALDILQIVVSICTNRPFYARVRSQDMLIAIIMLVMIIGKYADKKARKGEDE